MLGNVMNRWRTSLVGDDRGTHQIIFTKAVIVANKTHRICL